MGGREGGGRGVEKKKGGGEGWREGKMLQKHEKLQNDINDMRIISNFVKILKMFKKYRKYWTAWKSFVATFLQMLDTINFLEIHFVDVFLECTY